MKRLWLLVLMIGLAGCEEEQKPAPYNGVKRVVRITPFATKTIELDDGSKYGMGENLYNRLVTRLEESGRFVVIVNENWAPDVSRNAQSRRISDSDRLHFDFPPVPAGDFHASIETLGFSHGSRGMRRFAGFSSEFKTPFNDGRFENENEFPPRALDFVFGWFGNNFDPIGSGVDSTIAGVDAGEEGEFNVGIGHLRYRRDSYLATAQVDTRLTLLAENVVKLRRLDASGKGFLFAVGAGYRELNVEFGMARRDALKKAFDAAVEKIAQEVEAQLFAIPFRTRIEKLGKEGIILNAGRREGIRVGQKFLHKAGGNISTLIVKECFQIGSRAELLDSERVELRTGDVVVLEESTPQDLPDNREVTAPVTKIEQRSIVIDPPEFSDPNGDVEKGLEAKGLLLPLYLLRWSQYDQDIKTDLSLEPRGDIFASAERQWNLKLIRAADVWRKGYTGRGVKVAVIDSGIDYNHKNLAHSVPRNYAGFDFMSHDLRPYDDNSHGTAVAGIIGAQGIHGPVGVAPDATLLSYKTFDPYGETTSSALYGAVDRALRDGARILVLGWATKKESMALLEAIRRSDETGALVVVAAGDRGDDLREVSYFPAGYSQFSHLIRVANLDGNGRLSTEPGRHSNYGLGAVDIAAPGTRLPVLAPRDSLLVRTGTDLAAAHVAGAAALAWEARPEATAKEIKDMILDSARKEPSLADKINEGRVLDLGNLTR